MMVSLDGFFEGLDHDLSWHTVDDEFNTFAAEQMTEAGMLLFGRRTYELMRDFWPTYKPVDPENTIVRERMDTLPKIVFSKTLKSVEEHENWKHVMLVRAAEARELKKLKQEAGKDLVVLGSNNLCISLIEATVLDELRIMVNPVVIGRGTRLFEGLVDKLPLQLVNTRMFQNGNVLLYYQVVAS